LTATCIVKAILVIIQGKIMVTHVCTVCGYEYDPEVGDPDGGIAAATSFEEIPEDWVCPVCGATKDLFEPADL